MKRCEKCGLQYSEEWIKYCPLDGGVLTTGGAADPDKEGPTPSTNTMTVVSLGPNDFTVTVRSNREPDPLWSESAEIVVLAMGPEAEQVTFKELFANIEQTTRGTFDSANGFFHFKVGYQLGSVDLVIQCPNVGLQKHIILWK